MPRIRIACLVVVYQILATLTFTHSAAANETASFLSIFNSAQSDIDPNESASNKVKLSGRQTMLTQSIAKSICFAYLGVKPDEHLLEAAQASSLFSETLSALKSGSGQKGIIREENPEIKKQLDMLSENWRPFKNIVNSVLTSRKPTLSDLQDIQEINVLVLEQTAKTSAMIEKHYGGGELGADLANTINIAGQPRTLTQKAAKEFCMSIAKISREKNLAALDETRERFFDTIFYLFFGNEEKGILAPASYELDFEYTELFGVWFLLEEIFELARERERPEMAQLELSAELTKYIVEHSEHALSLY